MGGKPINLDIANWGSNGSAKVDEDAYTRLAGRLARILSRLERCNTEDPNNWQELTGASRADLRKSLGV